MEWVLAAVCPPFPSPFPHAARREGEQARRFSPSPPCGGRAGDGGPFLCDEFQPTRIHCPPASPHAERSEAAWAHRNTPLRRVRQDGVSDQYWRSCNSAGWAVTYLCGGCEGRRYNDPRLGDTVASRICTATAMLLMGCTDGETRCPRPGVGLTLRAVTRIATAGLCGAVLGGVSLSVQCWEHLCLRDSSNQTQ